MQDATDFEAPSQEDVRTDVLALFRGAIRMTLEALLEEEIREMVGGTLGAVGPEGPSQRHLPTRTLRLRRTLMKPGSSDLAARFVEQG